MGCLIDKYFVRIKSKWKDSSIQSILEELDPKYHEMLSLLWNQFHNLNDILDSENFESIMTLLSLNKYTPNDDIQFTDRYRGECLQKELRTKFFDTLIVIQNEPNLKKYNVYYVLDNNSIINIKILNKDHKLVDDKNDSDVVAAAYVENFISNEQCVTEIPQDQSFVQEVIDDLSTANKQGLEFP